MQTYTRTVLQHSSQTVWVYLLALRNTCMPKKVLNINQSHASLLFGLSHIILQEKSAKS